jgi:hypothetical protein
MGRLALYPDGHRTRDRRPSNHTGFLTWVRDAANGFQSAMLAMNERIELSVKVAAEEALACAS